MARATFNIQKIFEMPILGSEDLKLYFEASVLGVKDYPVFYTDITKRIPVMVGFNLPTFKLLDLAAIQVEHYGSQFADSYLQRGNNNANIPAFPTGQSKTYSKAIYNDVVSSGSLSWNLLLKKTLIPGFSLAAQFGKDHSRMVSSDYYYGPNLEPNKITIRPDDWYWMVQFGLGI